MSKHSAAELVEAVRRRLFSIRITHDSVILDPSGLVEADMMLQALKDMLQAPPSVPEPDIMDDMYVVPTWLRRQAD